MEIKFEKASVGDAQSIFELFCELVEKHEDLTINNYEKIKKWEKFKLSNSLSEYYSIFCDDEKVGYVHFFQNESSMEIDDFYILNEFRNRGVGTETLRKLKSSTDMPISLFVFKNNLGAIKFYEREGFKFKEDIDERRMVLEYRR